MRTDLAGARADTDLRTPLVSFMAIAAAVGTAAIYLLQPAIADVGRSLEASTTTIGAALACGPAGYLVGLGVLVPMVDRFSPRVVLAAEFIGLAMALAATATVADAWLLGLCVFVSGFCSSVGAGLSSLAGRLSSAGRRATVLGVVTAGISAGILGGRMVGGWLADALGWRGMLLVFAATCAAIAGAALRLVPALNSSTKTGYLETLRSIPGLYIRFASLRLAAARGTAWFFAFCAIWGGLAVALSEPPYGYSAERIGVYALAGLSGIVATRISGVCTDRFGARRVILAGLAMAGGGTVVLGFALDSFVLALVCLAVFDAGLFAAQVANQSTVLAIEPQAPARFNSAYMIVYFVGGTLGTAFGAAAVTWIGWLGTTGVAVGAIAVGAVITCAVRPSPHQ